MEDVGNVAASECAQGQPRQQEGPEPTAGFMDQTQAVRNLTDILEDVEHEGIVAAGGGGRPGHAPADPEDEMLCEKSCDMAGMAAEDMAAELQRLRAELASTSTLLDEATTARNQLSDQLAEANKQLARSTAAAAAAEERLKADMQQMQVCLVESEAKCRSLQQANGSLHDEALALQGQLQEERRLKDEQASERRRAQHDLEAAVEALMQAQRAQRSSAARAGELEAEVEGLRAARSALESELQAASARVLHSQEETREVAERNAELSGQLHGLSAKVRQLEAEIALLAGRNAALAEALEARAAEVSTARGEAAEVAAGRAKLVAEMQTLQAELEEIEASRLREQLSETRSEVSRLQAELAANDRVLADAEAALLSLVADRDGLEQQMNAAREAERRAAEAAEALRMQVATLQTQLGAALEGPLFAELKASGALASAVRDRMAEYLQVLSADGPRPRSSGGASVLEPALAARSPGGGPKPPVILTPNVATAAAFVSAPAAKRYLGSTLSSEAGSGPVFPVSRQSGPTFGALRSPSVSKLDSSLVAAGSSSPHVAFTSHKGPTLSPLASRSSDAFLHLDTAAPSGGHAFAPQEVSTGTKPLALAALSPVSSLSRHLAPLEDVAPVRSCASAGAESAPADEALSAATGVSPQEELPTVFDTSAAELVEKSLPSLNPIATAPIVPLSGAGSGDGIVLSGSPPIASPSAVTRRRAATERAGSNTRQSLERLIGEMAVHPPQPSAPSPVQEATAEEEEAFSITPPADVDDVIAADATPLTAQRILPDPALPYPLDTCYADSPNDPDSPTALSRSPTILSAEASVDTGLEAAEPRTPTPAVQEPQPAATPVPTSPTPAAEGGAGAQCSSPVLTPLSILPAVRPGTPGSGTAAGDSGGAGRPSGLVGGGSSTSMISPRNMLEGRMLTRAVRQVADALSRPTSVGGTGEPLPLALGSLPLSFNLGEEQLSTSNMAVTGFKKSTSLLSPLPSWRQAAAQQLSAASMSSPPAPNGDGQPADNDGPPSPASLSPEPETPSPSASPTMAGTDVTASAAVHEESSPPLPVPFAAAPSLAQMARRISSELYAVSTSGVGTPGGVLVSTGSIRTTISLPMAAAQSPRSRAGAPVASPPPEATYDAGDAAAVQQQPVQRRLPLQPASPRLVQHQAHMDRIPTGLSSAAVTPVRQYSDDETGSLLAQRLAAMDEALRAIGAI